MNVVRPVSLLLAPLSALAASAVLAQDLQFTLYNETSSALVEFYISTSESDSWEENLIVSPIEAGDSATVLITDGETVCEYDIFGVFENGAEAEDYELNLCELGSYTYTE
jgi:PhoPQ-activated pathogenicity-related protein